MADLTLRMGTWNCQAVGGHYIEIPSLGPDGMAYVYINTVGTIAWAKTPPAIEDTALAPEQREEPEAPAREDNAVVEGEDVA